MSSLSPDGARFYSPRDARVAANDRSRVFSSVQNSTVSRKHPKLDCGRQTNNRSINMVPCVGWFDTVGFPPPPSPSPPPVVPSSCSLQAGQSWAFILRLVAYHSSPESTSSSLQACAHARGTLCFVRPSRFPSFWVPSSFSSSRLVSCCLPSPAFIFLFFIFVGWPPSVVCYILVSRTSVTVSYCYRNAISWSLCLVSVVSCPSLDPLLHIATWIKTKTPAPTPGPLHAWAVGLLVPTWQD